MKKSKDHKFRFGLEKYTDFHPAPQNGTGFGFGRGFSVIIKLPLCVCVCYWPLVRGVCPDYEVVDF